MKKPDRVLIVDDEPYFRERLSEELAKDGWIVEAVDSATGALDAMAKGEWSVVLIDQKLRGSEGPDSGLELIEQVRRVCPDAKPIVITAYADPETVRRAYENGAYDFVEKTESFEVLVRLKVRNTMEALLGQWRSSLRHEGADDALKVLRGQLESERDSHRKGRLLEDLLELSLAQVPGFVVTSRQRTADEEFDLVVRNESPDPFWSKEGSYLLVECKNWSSKVGPDELDRFTSKLARRYDRTRLGFFVSIGGFTTGFESTRLTKREGNVLAVPIDGEDLRAMIRGGDIGDALKALHQRATVSSNAR